MKKTLFFILILSTLTACGHVQYKDQPIAPSEGDKWIVEEKSRRVTRKYLIISNIENPTRRRWIEIGNYTFEHIDVGDTVTNNGKKIK